MPPEVAAALRAKFGLDDPIYLRYLHWLTAMLHGDWGFSFVSRMNVDTLILQRLPATLYVIGSAQLLALAIAIPVGVYAATRPYSIFDQIANTLAFIGLSIPEVLSGLLLLLFAAKTGWFPVGGMHSLDYDDLDGIGKALDLGRHLLLPALVVGLLPLAGRMRQMRGNLLDVLRLDYVTTARAKGLGQARVIVKHAMRNAMIPVVTLVALQMPAVFGGAIVTEQIFRIPGIGSLLISSILSNDTPVVMAVTFVFACLVVLFNLIADVLYGWLDPRISLR